MDCTSQQEQQQFQQQPHGCSDLSTGHCLFGGFAVLAQVTWGPWRASVVCRQAAHASCCHQMSLRTHNRCLHRQLHSGHQHGGVCPLRSQLHTHQIGGLTLHCVGSAAASRASISSSNSSVSAAASSLLLHVLPRLLWGRCLQQCSCVSGCDNMSWQPVDDTSLSCDSRHLT